MLLIGSHALIHHNPDLGRRPLDIDVIATFDELGGLTSSLKCQTRVESIPLSVNKTVLRCEDGRIVEVELGWEGTAARKLLDAYPTIGSHSLSALPFAISIATLDELYTLKMSHRYLKNSPHFLKTRSDIMTMRALGALVFDRAWLKQREDETYVYKHPKLNVMKKDFFTGDGVQYVYDHDDIHRSVAQLTPDQLITLYDSGFRSYFPPTWGAFDALPAYELYKMPGEEVKCSRDRFEALPEHVRLAGVLEEAYVLALERSQIPFRGKVEPRRSFDIALQKVCTSITSGWFREFAWERFDVVEGMFDPGYADRFWSAVSAGRVRKL
jgi:hypothetical protein